MVLVVLKPTAGAAEELESLQGKQGVSLQDYSKRFSILDYM